MVNKILVKNLVLFGLIYGLGIFDVFSQGVILPQEITIMRDSFGVPHIFGKTDAAVAYGLAWAHCEDDFSSIEANLAPAKGLSKILNTNEGEKKDFFLEWLNARKIVTEKFDHELSPEYKAILQGYAEGLNAYTAANPSKLRLKKLFPVTTIDLEVAYLGIFATISGANTAFEATILQKPFRHSINYDSNAFAFNSNKTDDASTVIISDPNWLINNTLNFFEANLYSDEGWTLSGAFLPGIPLPLNAITPNHAWSLTYNSLDLIDIYQLKINPQNPEQYRFEGAWLNFQKRTLPVATKTGFSELKATKEILQTIHGPAIRTKHGVYAFSIAALSSIGAVQELYEMSKSENFDSFRKAVSSLKMPLFNVVYGDKNNQIWYIFNGKIPPRNTDFNRINILQGDSQKFIYQGFIPIEKLPQVADPVCGYVYNTSGSPFLCTAPPENPDSNHYDKNTAFLLNPDNDKAKRFREIMNAKNGRLSYQDIVNIIYDTHYPKDNVIQKSRLLISQLDPRVLGKKYIEAVKVLQQCTLDVSEKNLNIAFFLLVFNRLFEVVNPDRAQFLQNGLQYSLEQLKEAVVFSDAWMRKYHKGLQVPLKEFVKLVRDRKALELPLLPQLLHSCEGIPDNKMGVIRINRTSSLLQIAVYQNGKLSKIESIHPYGNSNNPQDSHYTDQMNLFICHERKTMSLDKNEVLLKAQRMYTPEAESKTKPPK